MRARKRFGQHVLESAWADKVVQAIGAGPDDVFIEIGPGRGALTRPLAARAKSVIAAVLDRDLAAHLRATMPPTVTVVEGDFLEWPRAATFDSATSRLRIRAPLRQTASANGANQAPAFTITIAGRLRVAGNLPYNIASPILFALRDLYAAGWPIDDATL